RGQRHGNLQQLLTHTVTQLALALYRIYLVISRWIIFLGGLLTIVSMVAVR
ncbi:MAG: hypothetical protein IV113_18595, partial [Hydrogenophaga sp.]|nr:hypothetical protein [Hydrogenophaga sp.]